jgi:hypothetical protein
VIPVAAPTMPVTGAATRASPIFRKAPDNRHERRE